jgi:agmatine deiminase
LDLPSKLKNSSPADKTSPRALGYRMPAEWEPHRATWFAWPHNSETWPDPSQLAPVKEIWVQMARALTPGEEACLLVRDGRQRAEATRLLKDGGAAMERICFYSIPTVDVWMRDYGPTFVIRGGVGNRLALNDWIFNAWGRKYESYMADDSVCREMAKLLGLPVFKHEIVLEGGAIDVNGRGACLVTEQCLLNPNRNPHLGRKEIEQALKDSLGVDRLIWLGEGIVGDDTDGHIDDIARFVDPTTILCAVEENSRDENYRPLQENLERLEGAKDQDGQKIEVVKLPMPGPVMYEGARLPASYANFYVANGVVLVPTYDHPNDAAALGILGELFPDRRIVGIPCAPLVAGLGAIHCVTQQEPAVAGS